MRREPPVRKTPLHDPVTCAHIRQGLSNTFLPAYPPERGTISYLSPTSPNPTLLSSAAKSPSVATPDISAK
jgi:hypothetical protein